MKIKQQQGTAIIGRSVSLSTTEQVAMTEAAKFVEALMAKNDNDISDEESERGEHIIKNVLIPFCKLFCLEDVDVDKTFEAMFKQVENKRTSKVFDEDYEA